MAYTAWTTYIVGKAKSYLNYLQAQSQITINLDKYRDKINAGYQKRAFTNINYDINAPEFVNAEINQVRENIERILASGDNTNYTATDLVVQLSQLENLNRDREIIEKSAQEVTRVKDVFGDFNTQKIVKDQKGNNVVTFKTCADLSGEKEDRLAMLSELHATGKISEKEFVETVVSVRRVYGRQLEQQSVKETAEAIKQQEEDKKPINKIIKKIKSIFKIGNEPENSEPEPDSAERSVIKQSALDAIINVASILKESGKKEFEEERASLYNEYIAMAGETSYERTSISSPLLFSIAIEDIYDANVNNVETDEEKDNLWDKADNVGNIYKKENGTVALKTEEEFEQERKMVSESMLNRFKHTEMWIMPADGKSQIVYKFEDPEEEAQYNDIMAQYKELHTTLQEKLPFRDIINKKIAGLEFSEQSKDN